MNNLIRQNAKMGVEACRAAVIHTAMIKGDHKDTAVAVGMSSAL